MATANIFVETLKVATSEHATTVIAGQPVVSREPTGIITMPHVVAKELAMILRKQLKEHEAKYGIINIPPQAYEAMKIAPEDW